MEWVQPNSAGSNENTSWYLAMSGSVCQLRGPGIQATQVLFIKQCTMSLPNGQSRGIRIMRHLQPPPAIALPQGVWAQTQEGL